MEIALVRALFIAGLLAATLGLGLGLSACGSDDGFPNRMQPDIGADGTKTLRRGNAAEPKTLDPHQASGVPAANILRDLYEGLVMHAPDGHVVPGDASAWRISADRTVYTFTLRDDARWSNGSPVTANDYVFSLRRAVAPKTASPYADIHSPIVNADAIIAGDKAPQTLGVSAPAPHTLRITLDRPTPYFLKTLAHASSYPVYPPAVKKWGDAFTQPGHAVTNGAYEMAGWRVNDRIVIKRNPQYWDNAHTAIDRVAYYPITDGQSELARYQSGALDFTDGVPVSRLATVRKHVPDQLHSTGALGVVYFGLNVTRPPFKGNRKLRLALSMALDRKIFTDRILRGGQIRAYSWIPTVTAGYRSVTFPWAGLADKQREARARQLYHEAGYSSDHPLRAEFLYPTGANGKKLAIVAAAMWRKVLGAEITPRNEEWKVYLADTRRQIETQIFYAGWIGDYEDPNTFFSILNSHAALDYTGYHSERYDHAQSLSEHTPDGPERARLMHDAERTLLHDSPLIPVYFYAYNRLIKPYVKGFVGNPLGAYHSKDLDIVAGHDSGEGA